MSLKKRVKSKHFI